MYASPRAAKHAILWNNLISIVDSYNLPYIIAGDFNEPLTSDDKLGGQNVSVNRSLLFKECLDRYNMINLGFTGPRFTWTNCRDIDDLIQERID